MITVEESEKVRIFVFLLVVVVIDDNLCLFLFEICCPLPVVFIIAMYFTIVKSKILEIPMKKSK